MSSNQLIKHEEMSSAIEQVLVGGNLAPLNSEQRVSYYKMVCDSVGLNPLTRPFEYITLNGKLTLYARKDCTDQLRNVHNVSVNIIAREFVEGCYVVTSRATLPSGRQDESIGAVPIEGLKGEARANAMMKTETKAKRRVTLSICGLGILDETEIETIPSAKPAAEATVTAKPITFKKQESASVNQDQGGATVIQEAQTVSPQDADNHSTAEPQAATLADSSVAATAVEYKKLAKEAKAALSVKPASLPEGCIEEGQAVNFERTFKDALKPSLRKDAKSLAHKWLKSQGIVDGNGEPTAKAILKANYYDVREEAVTYAASLA
jgi:hypothetical protein